LNSKQHFNENSKFQTKSFFIIPKLQQDDMKNAWSKLYLTSGIAQTVVLVAINNRHCKQQQ